MTKCIFMVFLFLSTFIVSCSYDGNMPVTPKSDLRVGQIYGHVSRIIEKNYWTKKVGGVIKIGEGSQVSIYDYNDAGNIVCDRFYSDKNILKDSTVYTYDVYNRLVKSVLFEKNFVSKVIYYFWSGRRTIMMSNNKYIGELEYDKEGNLISTKRLKADGQYETTKAIYDKFGRLTERDENYSGKTSSVKFTYGKGRKLEYVSTSRSGISSHFKYKRYLDRQHNIIWSFSIDDKGEAYGGTKYIYHYQYQKNE